MIKEVSDTAEKVDRRTKIQTLSLAKDVYGMKMELLATSTVADMARKPSRPGPKQLPIMKQRLKRRM
jgi:hypothetical protein